jgi:hypothetical protein
MRQFGTIVPHLATLILSIQDVNLLQICTYRGTKRKTVTEVGSQDLKTFFNDVSSV